VIVSAMVGTAACGGGGSSPSSGGTSTNTVVTLGTTDSVVSLDPAGSYDLPSWTVIYNVYQTLIKIPVGSTIPVPDAASCNWQGTGATTYVCTLKSGLKFSNGDPVTGADVVYSFDRILKINDPNGPSSLLAPICPTPPGPPHCTPGISASGNVVTFTLSTPDAVWPYVLTTGAGAIVDHAVFPAASLLADASTIGSGPYKIKEFDKGLGIGDFVANPNYKGDDQLQNKEFIIRYEKSDSTLVQDVKTNAVDIAYRGLSPTDVKTLQAVSGLAIDQGTGIEIRYLVFNLHTQPGGTAAQKLAIRQAVAYTINRQQVATDVYDGTVKPLYSIIPVGLQGHTEAFASQYGTTPDVTKAQQVLAAAGVSTPVSMSLWYNSDHYQAASIDEFTDYMRQLNASGLFNATLQTEPWTAYSGSSGFANNGFAFYQLGWFPDYPDPDDYTSPFYLGCNGAQPFMNDHYCNPTVDSLIHQEEVATDQTTRNQIFAQLQTLTAADAPLIPLWQGGQLAVVHNTITGVKSTLDPSYTFRFWLIGRS